MNPTGVSQPRVAEAEVRILLTNGLLDAKQRHGIALSWEQCAALAGELVPTANEIVRRRRPVTRGPSHKRATVERQRRLNEESQENAERSKQPWTGPELELASRPDLSARDVAAMIGRSFYAVKTMRKRLLVDPKKQRLAHGGGVTP